MRLKMIFNMLGLICVYIGIVIFAPSVVALYYKDFQSFKIFTLTALISIVLGFILKGKNFDKEKINDLKKSEALFTVAFSWILFSIIASVPYYFYGLSPINSLFEGVSGVTTTGATILTHFDYPKTFFFWRAFSQWLGAMGIIVLFVAILPQFKVAGRQLFFAEAPGPTEDRITPRIRNTAKALWAMYLGLTLLEISILHLLGMPWFDSVCNSFATLSAGGFSSEPQSMIGYNSLIIWVVSIFMFLAGANFALQYKVITSGNFKIIFKNSEFIFYFSIVVFLGILCSLGLFFFNHFSFSESTTHGFFQIISIITSTGFASFDFTAFNIFSKLCIILTMLIGGCAGSAAGGIKVVRVLIVFKYLKIELKKILHPNGVFPLKLDGNVVNKEIVLQILAFVLFYILIAIISTVVVTGIEGNMSIALSGTLSTLANAGPGFGSVIGPMGNFDSLNGFTKFVFIINMLVGRLEIIPFLTLFQKESWNFKK